MSGPRLAVAVLALLVAGCAAAPERAPSSAPRVRCLSDPTETGTRPLVFLFCIESP